MLTPEQLEILENSFLGELRDSLDIETDPEIRQAIEEQITRILNG